MIAARAKLAKVYCRAVLKRFMTKLKKLQNHVSLVKKGENGRDDC